MLNLGRRGLLGGIARFGPVPLAQAVPLHSLASFSPAVLPFSHDTRAFSSQAKYDPQGDMSAVTFHGPRQIKVSRKPKPRIQEPGVRTCFKVP